MDYWNLSYNDPGRWAEVHAVSGTPLKLMETLFSGGAGSPRGILVSASDPVGGLLKESHSNVYCNFQRTRNGGILYFRIRLETMGVPIRATSISELKVYYVKGSDFPCRLKMEVGEDYIEIGVHETNMRKMERFVKRVFIEA